MLIRMINAAFGPNGTLYAAGQQYDLPNSLALELIGRGSAAQVNNSADGLQGTGTAGSKPPGVPGYGIPFAIFPTAAAAGLGALQWESDFGILLRSDGAHWRPAGGHQMLRNLAADWVMSTPGSALQVCDSFDIPAGMLPPGAALEAVIGFDKLGGTSDTLTVRLRLGGTSVVLPALASTSVSAGTLQRFKRVSATTVQRVGGGNAAAIGALSSVSTSARPAAITVADLDANALTVELSGQMTTGSTEYGVIHHYTLSLVG